MATNMPPGSVRLMGGPHNNIILHPKPTDDYDDPLNWSVRRKGLHFGIVLFYIAVSFMVVDTPVVAHVQIKNDLEMNDDDIATVSAVRFAGLGLASIVLVPLAYRYGRRPIYLISALVQIVASIWLAKVVTRNEYLACSLIVGVGAAATQTLVPMTIADLFFVHQFATMNGWFLFAQGTGAFLGPVAGGYIVMLQGWRWIGAWTAILLATAFALILFLLEESTFVPTLLDKDIKLNDEEVFFCRPFSYGSTTEHVDLVDINRTMTTKVLELPPGPKTLRQRFALITRTKRPIKERFLSPFVILISFPAVAYAAVTYGSIIAWLTMYEHVAATKLFSAPYNFHSKDMGLFGIAPFIGHSFGSLVVPLLTDRWMVKLALQNSGIYQPEMRLWIAIPGAAFTCVGMLIFGTGISKDASWPILAVGFGTFAFGFSICLDVALAYIMDCYHNMIGDALVGITLVRNFLAVGVSVGITPWMDGMGIQNTFILTAAAAVVVLLIPVPLMIWGQKARVRTSVKYEHYSLAAIPPASLKQLMAERP